MNREKVRAALAKIYTLKSSERPEIVAEQTAVSDKTMVSICETDDKEIAQILSGFDQENEMSKQTVDNLCWDIVASLPLEYIEKICKVARAVGVDSIKVYGSTDYPFAFVINRHVQGELSTTTKMIIAPRVTEEDRSKDTMLNQNKKRAEPITQAHADVVMDAAISGNDEEK